MSKNFNKSVNNNFPKTDRNENDSITGEIANQISNQYRQVAEDTQEKAYELRDIAISRLRSNPFSTSAIIFASGLALGALLRK